MHMFEYDGDTNTATFIVGDSKVAVDMDFKDAHELNLLFNKSSGEDRAAGSRDVINHVNSYYEKIAL